MLSEPEVLMLGALSLLELLGGSSMYLKDKSKENMYGLTIKCGVWRTNVFLRLAEQHRQFCPRFGI